MAIKKSAKRAVGAAVGATAAVLAAGEVMYHCILNMDVQRWLSKKGFMTNTKETEFFAECELFQNDVKWYKELNPEVITVYSRLGRDMRAEFIPADSPSDKWAVVIHGYSAGTTSMSHYARVYHSMGYNVILPHMVGHDSDSVKYCSMGYYDKLVILDWINYIVNLNADAKILMHGVSMGAATTLLVTGEDLPDNLVCAIADCAYTSCWDEYAYNAKQMFRLPAFPIVHSANIASKRYKNFDFKECAPIEAVKKSKIPTLFIHGEDDDFVPYHMMQPLYESCAAADKQMLTVHGSFHANAVFIDNELYWKTVNEFTAKYI